MPLSIREVKDPALAVETLKSLVNGDLLQFAKTHGFTQLEGELEALSKTLYLSPSELVDEILNQENQNTMFSGHRFYDLLSGLARAGNEDMNQQIGMLLKAIFFSLNKQEILNALSANLKFYPNTWQRTHRFPAAYPIYLPNLPLGCDANFNQLSANFNTFKQRNAKFIK